MGLGEDRRLGKPGALLAVVVMAAVVGLAGCEGGGGEGTSLPSAGLPERSAEVTAESTRRTRTPEPTATRAEATRAEPTRAEPTRAETTRAETTRAETTRAETTRAETTRAETTKAQTTTPAKTATPAKTTTPPAQAAAPARTTAPAASASAAVVAVSSGGLGPYGWLLVLGLLVVLGVGGLLLYRSQRKSSWDTEAAAATAETRTITATRLPPVLTTTTVAQRGLAWPPVRAGLVELVRKWNALAQSALGEPRRDWAMRFDELLRDLIAAVDAENEALAAGRDWMVLRPRVNEVERTIAAVLASQIPEPPGAGEPGPPAYQI